MISDFLYTLKKIIKSRIFIVSLIVLGLFSVLIYRIFDLQIINENYYMSTYIQKAEKTIYKPGTRGRILDVKGNVLAYDVLAYAVTFEDKIDSSKTKNETMNNITYKAITIIEKYGDKITVDFPIILNSDNKWEMSFTSDSAKTRFLKNVFGDDMKVDGHDYSNASAGEIISYLKNDFFEIKGDYDDDMLLKMISIRYNVYQNSYQKYVTTTIANEVSDKTMIAISENEAELTGVTVEEKTIRKYNDSLYYAPILGYTGKISDSQLEELKEEGKNYISSDIVGKAGIESAMEDELQGKRGEQKIFVDSTGKVLSTISNTEAAAGNDVYLTIDSKLQAAAYKLLEKKIAGILISEILNSDFDEENQTDEEIHYIPVKKVYSQLVTNNVVSLSHLSKKSTDNEAKVYKKYKDSLATAVSKLKSQLSSSKGQIYNDLNDEFKEYYDYIYDLLKNDGILLTSSINTEDKIYKNYVDGKISMNEFIKYAIRQNWISIENLDVSNSYLSSEETYDLIVEHVLKDLKSNTSFGKKVVHYRIYDDTINGCEICMLLFDQKVLEKDDSTYSQLSTYDSSVSYRFIIKQIKQLKITPAQIALDPCSGSVVVTDPNTGHVRAMVTYPSYDNNMLSGTVDPEYWAKLVDDQSDPLYNRATQGANAPGSTFKMCTTMAAMEEDVVGQYETMATKGIFEKIKPSPKCWIYGKNTHATHGTINIMGALAQSCNYFFFEMGYRLGTKKDTYDSAYGLSRMEKYATELGLNMLSGVEITEREPHFSTESAVHSAIGQGSNAYTPVQLARYVSTIANGGKNYSLTLIDKVASSEGKTVYEQKSKLTNTIKASSSTWDAIHSGMRQVVTSGTVDDYFKDTKIDIAGKSGTAQENLKRNSHSLFVAYAPYKNPKIAVSAVIPFGNSSHDSAELAKNVIQYYYGELKDEDINKEVKSDDTKHVTRD